MTPAKMETLCHARLDARLEDMLTAPQADILLEASAVAEILAIACDVASLTPIRASMSATACRWLQTGLLETALMAGTQYLYPAALLLTLAVEDPDFRPDDLATIDALLAAGIIGKAELPILTLTVVASHFRRCGLRLNTPAYSVAVARDTFDKRVIRARTDEYDLSTLIMVAQIARAEGVPPRELPLVLPQTMLVQALRLNQANWLAVLALLNATVFEVVGPVRRAALDAVAAMIDGLDDLVPAPPAAALQNDYAERVPLGLRLRSSIACCAILNGTTAA